MKKKVKKNLFLKYFFFNIAFTILKESTRSQSATKALLNQY